MYQPQPQPSASSSATTTTTAAAADPTFWSPSAPPHAHTIQPTSILQRPPQPQQQPQQQSAIAPPPPPPPTTTSSSLQQQLPPGAAGDFAAGDYSQIFEWVSQLLKGPDNREKALSELSKKREQYDDLALILWHSFGKTNNPFPLLKPFPFRCFLFSGLFDCC